MNPRTLCACQLAAFINSARPAPFGRLIRSRILAPFVPGRNPRAVLSEFGGLLRFGRFRCQPRLLLGGPIHKSAHPPAAIFAGTPKLTGLCPNAHPRDSEVPPQSNGPSPITATG
jgi:hypothetical protein